MEDARKTTKPDVRRTLTCATLATITTLGMFSLVANVMTPMFAAIQFQQAIVPAPDARAGKAVIEEKVCVQANIDDARGVLHLSVI